MHTTSPQLKPDIEDHLTIFIARWESSNAAETANSQSFVIELCDLLGVEHPRPTGHEEADYVFERAVINVKKTPPTTNFIDLYRKGCFVWENKQGSDEASAKTRLAGTRIKLKVGTAKRGTPGWGRAMTKAKNQAKGYAANLPTEAGWPPFLVVCDVGYCIDLFADFSGQGKHYAPFPDSNGYRIHLNDLRDADIRERLGKLWTDPASLDPSIRSAKVTRDLAEKLGRLAKRLEGKGHAPDTVAQFLMRSLFSMFAEDVGLLPEDSFKDLLTGFRQNLPQLPAALSDFWRLMDRGGFDRALKTNVKRFNGELFADASALQLDDEEAELLIAAAEAHWSEVEPAIFGTLLERALDPKERHKLGAHFTPRAYVERLVLPTIIEPLREDWQTAQVLAAEELLREEELAAAGKPEDGSERRAVRDAALDHLRKFHRKLCDTRVLDPACGSGNFLYVALEHMKRLEGEVLREIEGYEGQQKLDMTGGYTVSPDQFLGIEINPRAAAIAEVVLWIGYLQWHFRTWGNADRLGEPILQRHHNIENKDAVLESFMGQDRMPEWPEADFIVGNPPFLWYSRLREEFGEDYVDRLQALYKNMIPDSTDYVMRWWYRCNTLLSSKSNRQLRRFGLITSNSITQIRNRRVIEEALREKNPTLIAYAVPDHPWSEDEDGAAVRIAMTSAQKGHVEGRLAEVVKEVPAIDDEPPVVHLALHHGIIASDLSIGADVTKASTLHANLKICAVGFKTIGSMFAPKEKELQDLGLPSSDETIRPFFNWNDVTDKYRGKVIIDLFGWSHEEVRTINPLLYNYLYSTAKPYRSKNRNKQFQELWWVIGHARPIFRKFTGGLNRFIATGETSKHRTFVFLDTTIAPESSIVCIGLDTAEHLSTLQSSIHVTWALASGGTLEDRPRYNKTRCFETFPFPLSTANQREKLAALGEELDALRKRVLAEHEHLTMTKLYNVLEAVREGRELTKKEQQIYNDGLVGTLQSIHDDIDLWTARAYSWIDDDTTLEDPAAAFLRDEQEVLQRLVDLNAARAADEARGIIHYLRPEYQNPDGVTKAQGELEVKKVSTPVYSTTKTLLKWSALANDGERLSAVRRVIARSEVPLSVEGIAAHFQRANRKRVGELVEALSTLGMVERARGGEGWVG